jgi:3-methylcrotonyl-CoA carboxylase beta subunit
VDVACTYSLFTVLSPNSALTLDPACVPALYIFCPSQNAKVSVMGSGQLSQVMQSVSRSVLFPIPLAAYVCECACNFFRDPSQHASLKAEIEAQSSSLYATARLWDDGIIKPTETRDVVGLGLALAAHHRGTSRPSQSSGSSGVSWDGAGRGFGVFRM